MEFSWWVTVITFFAMAIEAGISYYKDETFWRSQRRHVHMTFLWNWAISVGGLLILPIFNAIIVSQLRPEGGLYVIGFIVGILMTWLLYWLWWKQGNENKGHILYWYGKQTTPWTRDITFAGWLHHFYMAIEIMIMCAYIVSPMNQPTVFAVGVLFLFYVVLVNIQAKVVQHSFRWPVLVGELAAVAVVTVAKL